jgi:hypothetical protein
MRARLSTALCLLLPLVALACMAVFYLTGHPLRESLLANSDSLYLPTLFDDLLARHGSIRDWYLTPAPYYFPDYPLYFLAYWLGPDSYWRIAIYSLLQGLLLFGVLHVLARRVATMPALPCAALATVAFAALALSGEEPFVLLFNSAYHFGAFIAALAFAAAWLHWEDARAAWALAAAGALAFATTLSDSLFALQAALPFVAACVVRMAGDRQYLAGRRWSVALVLGLAVAGQMSYRFAVANKTRYSAKMDFAHLASNGRDLAALLQRLWQELPVFTVLWIACVAFGIAATVRLLRGRATAGLPLHLCWLFALWTFSLAASVAVSLLVHNLPVAMRYFIAAACWPLVLVPLAAGHLLQGSAKPRAAPLATGLAALAAGALVAGTAARLREHPVQSAWYPEETACIDRVLAAHGVRYGIAQYWDAKKIAHFSRSGMVLAQHAFDLSEIRWITSGTTFRPAYDFALVGPQGAIPHFIPRDRLEALNGKAMAEHQCGQVAVLVYGKDRLKVR